MKFLGTILTILTLTGCAVCSSSDNAEQCRTKQRDHAHPRTELGVWGPVAWSAMRG